MYMLHYCWVSRDSKQSKWLNQSHYREVARWEISMKKSEIWAGFGPVGNMKKYIWADYEQLLRVFFSCFQGQKKV